MSDEIAEEVQPEITEEVEKTTEPETTEGQTTEELKEEELSRNVQKRIDKLTRARYDAEREAQYNAQMYEQARRELEQLRQAATKEPEIKRPNPDDYQAGKYDPQYVQDLIDFQVEQKVSKLTKQQTEEQVQQQKYNQIAQQESAAREKFADFDEIVSDVMQSQLLKSDKNREILLELDNPIEMVYYLGRNPDELERLLNVPSSKLAFQLGKLEDKITSLEPVKKRVPNAPDPINPLKSSKPAVVAEKKPDKMTPSEYKAWRKKGGGKS